MNLTRTFITLAVSIASSQARVNEKVSLKPAFFCQVKIGLVSEIDVLLADNSTYLGLLPHPRRLMPRSALLPGAFLTP